jgi:hypothetical protein
MCLSNPLFWKGNFRYFRERRDIFRLAMLRLRVLLLRCDTAVRYRLPFLGVSSLNLAAPSGAAFFLCDPEGCALRLTARARGFNDAPSFCQRIPR